MDYINNLSIIQSFNIKIKMKKVTVVGFGKTGKALVKFLLNQGIKVALTDIRNFKALKHDLDKIKSNAKDTILNQYNTKKSVYQLMELYKA